MPFTVNDYNDIISGLGVLGGVGFEVADAVSGNGSNQVTTQQNTANTALPKQQEQDYTIAYILISVIVLALLIGAYLMMQKNR